MGVKISNRVVEEDHLTSGAAPPQDLRKTVSQEEEATSAKALGWDWAWRNQGSLGMPGCLNQSVQG